MAGLYALAGGEEALAARVAIVEAAERSLDVQYYIWRGDRSGLYLFEALRRAARRGVRVRLLLDDNNTTGLDETLMTLDAEAQIEVRLFNPFAQRKLRSLAYLHDFSRLNRRMHNKSLTSDGSVTIIGGRNIGDEYFDAVPEAAFADLDVLAVGPIVGQVSTDFDRYWASGSAYPVASLVAAPAQAVVEERLAAMAAVARDDGAENGARGREFLDTLLRGDSRLTWAVTRLVSDDPAQVLEASLPPAPLVERLEEILGTPRTLLEIVTAYFVPLQEGVDYLSALVRRGVDVRVLTNSLAATDVVAVHAGYARWRKALLEAGVSLYEYKPLAPTPGSGSAGGSGAGSLGSSSSSLHAKTFSVDHARVVIGSFNFDPRSLQLNTELGFIVDSPELARAVEDAFGDKVPRTAWQVTLTDAGELQWTGMEDGVATRHDHEPAANFWRRAGAAAYSILPFDWLL
jgi:putative cardiolipin synthase